MPKYAIYHQNQELNRAETEYVDCDKYVVREVKRGTPPSEFTRFEPTDEETLMGICGYLNRRKRAAKRG